jgi:hypothetical protein
VVSLGFNGDFFDSLVNRVGFSRLVFATPTVVDVTLVSGSLHYLVDKLRVQTGRVLGVLEHHFSGRVRNGRPAGIGVLPQGHWHRVRHPSVGGVTEYCALFCSVHCEVDPNTVNGL